MELSPQPLKPCLSEKFNSVIWKVELDEVLEILVVETRNKDTHSAAFSSLNCSSGECYFKEQTTENSWWWGLDRAYNGLIYLHGYKSEGSPEHSGIIAWDAKTGEVKWQRFNYALQGISDQGLIVHNPLVQSARPELLSPETGEVVKGIFNAIPLNRDFKFPQVFPSKLPDFIPGNIAGAVLFLKFKDKDCWAFHIKTDEGYTQQLLITQNNEVILLDNLASGIQKLNPEAFFMQKSYLFCIRNNNYELTSYLL